MCPENRSHTATFFPTPPLQTDGIYRESGFTLLELIIVLFLITVMLGLTGVFFANTLPSGRFNAATRDMVSTIRQASHLARINGEQQVLTIDMDSRRYAIKGRSEKQLPAEIGISVISPFSGEIFTGRYEMTFYAAGGSETGTVVLRSINKRTLISIDPVAGATVIK